LVVGLVHGSDIVLDLVSGSVLVLV
jgi:hypothetical protein